MAFKPFSQAVVVVLVITAMVAGLVIYGQAKITVRCERNEDCRSRSCVELDEGAFKSMGAIFCKIPETYGVDDLKHVKLFCPALSGESFKMDDIDAIHEAIDYFGGRTVKTSDAGKFCALKGKRDTEIGDYDECLKGLMNSLRKRMYYVCESDGNYEVREG